ncbi:putative Integral membrane protein S linking to the trans Golgi network [Trypanosoma cruzi]|nr:putative Integral membrane protein S linking to the trans Golgi network [Trypanosoma cruzi]
MPIPLGAPLSDPKFVFLQILHTLSMFFIMLGVVRVVLGVLSLTFIDSSALSVPLFTSLGYCFHVPLRSLFTVRVEDVSDGSAMRFFLMHLLTACFFSCPLALTIQRRKFALDFIFTLYAMYYVFCCLASWRLTGGGFAWWVSVLTGFCVLYGLTFFLCGRRELQDIFFPLPTAPAVAVGGSGGVCNVSNSAGGGDGDVMMATLGAAVEANGVDVDGCSFSNGCSSPRTVTEAVLMGPGSARKRRQ